VIIRLSEASIQYFWHTCGIKIHVATSAVAALMCSLRVLVCVQCSFTVFSRCVIMGLNNLLRCSLSSRQFPPTVTRPDPRNILTSSFDCEMFRLRAPSKIVYRRFSTPSKPAEPVLARVRLFTFRYVVNIF
jgi:hypothetical protein